VDLTCTLEVASAVTSGRHDVEYGLWLLRFYHHLRGLVMLLLTAFDISMTLNGGKKQQEYGGYQINKLSIPSYDTVLFMRKSSSYLLTAAGFT